MDNHPHHPEDKCGPGCTVNRTGPVIIELTEQELDYLIAVAQNAQNYGQTLKVAVDGGFKFKRGESMWTAPMGHRI